MEKMQDGNDNDSGKELLFLAQHTEKQMLDTSMGFLFKRTLLCQAFLNHREDSDRNNKSPVDMQFCNITMVKPASSRKK